VEKVDPYERNGCGPAGTNTALSRDEPNSQLIASAYGSYDD